MSEERRCVVLLSGGLDSATTLAWAIEKGYAAYAMTVSYGQRQAVEVARARAIAAASSVVEWKEVHVDLGYLRGSALTDSQTPVPKGRSETQMGEGIPTTYVPARNTLFLSLALGWAESLGAGDLFIGANQVDYSGYPDCRPEFLQAFERLARAATKVGVEGGEIRVHAPLIDWSKSQIILEAQRLGVDLAGTISCYDPTAEGTPCRECDACRLRAKGFDEAGFDDPAVSRLNR